ncbi:hypothetical protein [Kitasatospora sp. NPDC089509]|uniref:hypothetical protein n=1 Tax=Kitasatospora sp. NPDC089509 TaxID=3364079 RepID=UPI003808F6F3
MAKFRRSDYRRIANLEIKDFIAYRNSILSRQADDYYTRALQASFFSNGVTGIFESLQPDILWNVAAQHDFRYTIGPNVTLRAEWEAERRDADKQFCQNVRGIRCSGSDSELVKAIDRFLWLVSADIKSAVLSVVGNSFFARSPINDDAEVKDIDLPLCPPTRPVTAESAG